MIVANPHREHTMKLKSRLAIGLLGAALALSAQAGSNVTDPNLPRSLPADGPVDVSWSDPAKFSDLRSGNRWEAERGDWVRQLAQYTRERATKQLAPGEKLEIAITDIQRAGRYEPWLGPQYQNVRIIRDYYPPRISLTYTLYGADGQVLAQNERKLSDAGFLMGSTPLNQTDPLRFEKRMVDSWIRRDLGPQRLVGSR